MGRRLTFLFLLWSAGVLATPAIPVPAPPSFDASGYLLVDFHSGRVLAERSQDDRVEPASITKLMTAYVVYTALESGTISTDDQVLVSEKAWRTYGSRMFIEVGKRVKVSELLRGIIIQSGNDASVALAEHVAGTEGAFANMMNAQAQSLGMTATNYVNATGLPDENHYTSARDIATLTRALIHDFPEFYKLYSEREYTYNGITQYNRNKLLWRDDSVDGVKTGHTESSGYSLVSSAERDGMRLVAVVLGTESESARAKNSEALLNYGFRFFETHKLYAARESLTEARVWKGDVETVPVGLKADLYVTIPRGQYQSLKAAMELTPELQAPVQAGDDLGDVRVTLGEEVVKEQSLVALSDVGLGGIWRRSVDAVKQWFR